MDTKELFDVLREETLPRVAPARAALEQARQTGEAAQLGPARELMHRIAGTAALVGLPALSRLGRFGEQVAHLGLDGEAKVGQRLCELLGSVLDAIEADLDAQSRTAKVPDSVKPESSSPAAAATERARVALASDENVSAKLLLRFLDEAGFDPKRYTLLETAASLPECDVLLVDMPTAEAGLPWVEQIFAAAAQRRLPLLLTARGDPGAGTLKDYSYRAAAFLPKPVVPELLVQMVRTQSERRKAAVAARARAPTAAMSSPEAAAVAAVKNLKVLIVDDSRVIRGVVREALAEVGLVAIEAEDGVQALAIFDAQKPDAVISDVQMPGLDGAQLTKVLRERGGKVRIPIVVLSALDDERSRRAGLAAGADAYLVKNVIDGPALLKALKDAGLPIP